MVLCGKPLFGSQSINKSRWRIGHCCFYRDDSADIVEDLENRRIIGHCRFYGYNCIGVAADLENTILAADLHSRQK